MNSHEDLTTSSNGINVSKNGVLDKATQTFKEISDIDYYLYFPSKHNKVSTDNDKEPLCSIISKVVYEKRIKEYAAVNEARLQLRNARAEYIGHLEKFSKKIGAFDEKYNDSDLKARVNLWKDALAVMQYEKRRSKSIKYDCHLQVRLEIEALRKAREDYEEWIDKFDKRNKKYLCCSCCRESL